MRYLDIELGRAKATRSSLGVGHTYYKGGAGLLGLRTSICKVPWTLAPEVLPALMKTAAAKAGTICNSWPQAENGLLHPKMRRLHNGVRRYRECEML